MSDATGPTLAGIVLAAVFTACAVMGYDLGAIAVAILAVAALIPAAIAHSKGAPFGDWWAYGTLLFIFAFIHSIALRPIDNQVGRSV